MTRALKFNNKKIFSALLILLIVFSTFSFPPKAEAAITQVQQISAGNNNATTVAATWPSTTTVGNLLVAVIAFRGGSAVTITPPTGWTLAIRANNALSISTAIYYIANASAQSGASSWSLGSTKRYATLSLAEYSGVATSSPLDVTATNTGTTSTGSTGTTSTTTQANELAIAGISFSSSSVTLSGWTNSFTEVSQVASTGGPTATNRNKTGMAYKILSSTGTQTTSLTSSAIAIWSGAIATFKKANVAPTGTFNSATQATDGTGKVNASITVNDEDKNNSKAKIEYSTSSTCAAGTRTKATLTTPITATVTPAPDLTQANAYQIGTTTPILTTSANTVTFVWDSKTDLPNATGGTNYYLCLTTNDGTLDQTTIGASSAIALDNTAPTVSLTSPTTGAVVNASKIITFTDNDTTSPQCSVDNTNWATCTTGVTTLGSISQFASITEGNTFTLYLRDTDGKGNVGTNNVANLKKDTTNPTSTISTPADNSYATSTTVALTGTSTDTNLSATTISVDGGAYVATSGTAASWTYSATSLSQGAHTFQTKATDLAGNTGLSAIVHVTVDSIAPVITINNPTTAPAQSKTITASTDEGILTQSITTGSICDGTLTFTAYSSTTFTTEADNGKKVCYKAVDTATNTTYSMSNAIAGIDVTSPTVNSVAVQTALTVNLTFSEAMGTGVTTVSNYTLSGTGKGTLASNPNTIALVSGNTYVLTWTSGIMVSGGDITITVANAQDVVGNVIGSPNSATHTGGGIGLDHFAFNTIATQTIGSAFSITITAKDTTNNTLNNYAGTVDLSTTAGTILPTLSNAFSSGILTQSVTLSGGGNGQTITATDHGGTKTGTSNSFAVNYLLPTTTSILPTEKVAGDSGFTLTVNGTNFVNGSTVYFNGAAKVTTYVSATELTAEILTSDLTTDGTFGITVVTGAPGGGTSNSQTFTVYPKVSKFVIVNPTDGTVDAPITVTVEARKTDNSLDTTYQNDVTLVASGSATGEGLVDIVNGVGTINISDTVAQTVNLTLSDTQSTGLNVDSTQDVIFSPGAVKQFALNDPGDVYAKNRLGYTVERKDQYGNLVTSGLTNVNLYTSSVSSTAKFYSAATGGSVITSIDITTGHSSASFWYYDEEPGTYIISAKATDITDGTDTVVVMPVAVKFVIVNPTDGTVDAPITVTVEAQKPDNSVDTNYQTDVTLVADGSAVISGGTGLVNIVNGTGSLNISDIVAETVNLSLSDTLTTGLNVDSTQNVVFAGGAISQFILDDPGPLSAGERIEYTVTRKDQHNNLTTSGVQRVYLYSVTSATGKFYNALDAVITYVDIADGNSSANFWYYDQTPGTYTIVASDNSSGPDDTVNINDAYDSIVVNAGAVSKYVLNDPGDVDVGTKAGYIVTREDQFNNIASSGTNTVYLYSSSTTGTFYNALDNVITSVDITVGNSSANFWYSDTTPDTYTITASDNSSAPDLIGITDGTDSVIISAIPIVATKFVIVNPTDGTVDAPITVTVKAQDNSGNTDTSYQSDVTLRANGTSVGLVDIKDGVGTINISETLAQTVNLTLSDTQSTGLNVDSTQDVVFSVGAVSQFSLNNPGDMSAGNRIKYTVTRKDQYGNLVTSGLTVASLSGLPAETTKKFYDSELGGSVITFVNITDGNSSADFWYYDEHAATSVVRVSATGIAYAEDSVIVSAGSVAKFIINNPGDMSVNTRLGYTVSRQDTFGNAVSSGVTIVYLYTSSTGANAKFYDAVTGGLVVTSIPIDDGNSSANFWYYDETAGTWVITVSDSTPTANGATGVLDDADSVTVSTNVITATRFVIINPSNSTINVPTAVTIKAEDALGNVDTAYQSDVTLVASGSATGEGLVDIVNGVGTINISDTVAETVSLSLSDTQATGLNVGSTAQVVFSAVPTASSGVIGVSIVSVVGRVSFSGRAYPGAILSIMAIKETEDIIKKDTVSSNDGSFEITFTGLSAGSRAFALSVQDKDGRTAQTKIFDLNLLSANSTMDINNIIVSPTVGFPRSTVTKGDFLTVVGYAIPQSKLQIEIDGQLITADVTAGADGSYRYLYSTALLALGSHTIRASQTTADRVESEFSPQRVFFTTNLTVPKTDFNNDGKINISDWSIFLARWLSADPATRLLDDLNNDGKVNSTDFSIFIRTLRR